MKINYVAVALLAIPNFFNAMMPVYQNEITGIQDIQGAITYTLILSCEQEKPIAVYAPATYQESLNDQQVTIFMPNTTLAQGVDEIEGMVETTGSGVTISLVGKLKQKMIADHKIYITIEVVS